MLLLPYDHDITRLLQFGLTSLDVLIPVDSYRLRLWQLDLLSNHSIQRGCTKCVNQSFRMTLRASGMNTLKNSSVESSFLPVAWQEV